MLNTNQESRIQEKPVIFASVLKEIRLGARMHAAHAVSGAKSVVICFTPHTCIAACDDPF